MSARPALHRASDAINLVFEAGGTRPAGPRGRAPGPQGGGDRRAKERDWTRVTAAAVRRLAARFPAAGVGASVATADMRSGACAPATRRSVRGPTACGRVLNLLAGAARYAASYAMAADPAKAERGAQGRDRRPGVAHGEPARADVRGGVVARRVAAARGRLSRVVRDGRHVRGAVRDRGVGDAGAARPRVRGRHVLARGAGRPRGWGSTPR